MEAVMAGFRGFVGGAALLLGALAGLCANALQRIIALMMAVGVLVASVALELMEEAYDGGGFAAAGGLLLGALAPPRGGGGVVHAVKPRRGVWEA